MNILDIKYCAQDLQFEESAYAKFQTYETQLKAYFLKQEDGNEIFEDLKLRICEMLQSKMKTSGAAISEADVADIKSTIGAIEQLEDAQKIDEEPAAKTSETRTKNKKLYRSQNEKLIGGVSAGLGNYFSIDPLAFRLIFVLLTLSSGFGILAYAIFWVVLKPKVLPTNVSKRLYRNSADKVIAGVCGGLAAFFKTEAWIVRLIFLSPLVLNITLDGFFNFGLNLFNGSAMGFSIVAYIILWITTKETESPSEELLARGEEITLNNITEETKRANVKPSTNSGFNNVLRVFAFIIMGLALIPIFSVLVGLLFSTIFMMPLTNAVLHTPLLKWLGVLSILLFVILPLVALLVWGIRRIAGVKGPNKPLRLSFGGLWALGLASAITLSALLLGEMNKKSFVENKTNIPVVGDTLYVNKLDETFLNSSAPQTTSLISNFYEENENEHRSNLVSFKRQISPNDSFFVRTKIYAVGKGYYGAANNAKVASYKTQFANNELYLSKYLSIPKKQPYRFQHAEVTIYVPKGKTAIVEKGLGSYSFGNKVYRVHHDGDWDDMSESDKAAVKQEIEEAMGEVSDAIKEVSEEINGVAEEIENIELEDDNNSTEQAIERAERDAEKKIKIEKQKLRIRKEELRLEKLKQELEKESLND